MSSSSRLTARIIDNAVLSALQHLLGSESLLRMDSLSEWTTTKRGLAELHRMILSKVAPSRRKAAKAEWATTAGDVIAMTIESCAPAIQAASAVSGPVAAATLGTIGGTMCEVLLIFLLCFHGVEEMLNGMNLSSSRPPDATFSGTWLKLEGRLRHGLPRIIAALLSVASHLRSSDWDASLLHGLTAAICMHAREAGVSGGALVGQDALASLHCAHLRVSIALVPHEMSLLPASNLPAASWPGYDWLIGLRLLHSSPPPQESDVRRWQPLLPLLIRSSQLARGLLSVSQAVVLDEDLLRVLYEQGLQAPLELLVRFRDGASGCVWRFRCALEAMKAALDPLGPLQCNASIRSAVERSLLSEAASCMVKTLGKAGPCLAVYLVNRHMQGILPVWMGRCTVHARPVIQYCQTWRAVRYSTPCT